VKHLQSIFIAFIILNVYSCKKDQVPNPEGNRYKLVWSDEFNDSGLPDASKWSYDVGGSGWGNNETQYYTNARKENAEVKDGCLYITAIKEDFEGKSYTSARLVSKGKGDWKYGRFEIRAKLPAGTGTWPAIWMLPSENKYGGWPKSGEIDIMESLGYIPYFVAATVQTENYSHIQGTQKTAITPVSDCYTTFHNYVLEWDELELRFYVDSNLYLTFRNDGTGIAAWPFDKPFHLILNVAIGGTFGGAQGIDDNIFPQELVVDYVRIYQK